MATPYIVNWTVGLIWPGFNRPDQPREFQILRRQDRVFPWCPWWRWRAPWCAFRLTDTYAPSDDRRLALSLPIGPKGFHASARSFTYGTSPGFCLLTAARSRTMHPATWQWPATFGDCAFHSAWQSRASSERAAPRPAVVTSTDHEKSPYRVRTRMDGRAFFMP
jgi:hypothetical protein